MTEKKDVYLTEKQATLMSNRLYTTIVDVRMINKTLELLPTRETQQAGKALEIIDDYITDLEDKLVDINEKLNEIGEIMLEGTTTEREMQK